MSTRLARKKPSTQKPRRAPKSSVYTVFISHSSHDLWIANQIAKLVKECGGNPWLDKKDLRGGDVLQDAIIKGIRACHEAIVLISTNSVNSQWVAFEIGAVAVQRKRVTPVLNNVSLEAMAPMKGVKAIDLNEFDDFLGQLKGRINRRKHGKK
jgi:hypothetical protein